ncbi:MAG: hypothetical protein ABH867_04075 [Patescibacteria group bacterium]|nr:hypothetical protein [Patescibacteria group bacterium]
MVKIIDTGNNIRGSEFPGDMVGRPADELSRVRFDRSFPQGKARRPRSVSTPTLSRQGISGLPPEDSRGTCHWLVRAKGTGIRF